MIKTYLNREEHTRRYEVNNEPSETIPDQSMSIRTLLDRYSLFGNKVTILTTCQTQEHLTLQKGKNLLNNISKN